MLYLQIMNVVYLQSNECNVVSSDNECNVSSE